MPIFSVFDLIRLGFEPRRPHSNIYLCGLHLLLITQSYRMNVFEQVNILSMSWQILYKML